MYERPERLATGQSASYVGQFVHDECHNRGAKIDMSTTSMVDGFKLYRLIIDVKRGREISPAREQNLYSLHAMMRHAATCKGFKWRVHSNSGVGAVTWGQAPGEDPVPVRLWTPDEPDSVRINRTRLRNWIVSGEI